MVPCNHKQSVNPGKLMFTGEDVESCGTGVAVWPVRLCGCVRTLDSPLSGISDTTSVFAGIYINASNSQPHPRTSSCSVQCVCAYREDKPTDALSDEGEDNREKKHLHLLPPRHTLGNQKPTDTHTSNLSETALENQVVVWMDQRYCTCCVNQECYCMAADGSGNASIRVSTDGKAGCISTTGDAAHAHKLPKGSCKGRSQWKESGRCCADMTMTSRPIAQSHTRRYRGLCRAWVVCHSAASACCSMARTRRATTGYMYAAPESSCTAC